MSFSYSGNPADSQLAALRFVLRDVDPDDYHFEDEELVSFLLAFNITSTDPGLPRDMDLRRCALQVQGTIQPRMAETPSYRLGSLDERITQALELKFKIYQDERRIVTAQGWWAGGTSISDKLKAIQNRDAPPHYFAVGFMDFPGTQQNIFGIGGRLYPSMPQTQPG